MAQFFKGPSFYREDDEAIFLGRSEETEKLFNLVTNCDFSVCYAISGEGKSSLINAGLCPILRKANFFPVRINGIADGNIIEKSFFDNYIWNEIEDAVKEAQKKEKYKELTLHNPVLSMGCSKLEETAWWKLRNYELRLNSYEKLTPVLIFDQFEEIFTRPNDLNYTDAFFRWLQELYQDESPMPLEYDGILHKKYKILFSLRSEYVCELDYWSMNKYFIPSLKNNRYCLKPLTKNAAINIAANLKDLPKGFSTNDIVKYAKTKRLGDWNTIKNDFPCVSALVLSLILTGLQDNDKEIERKIEDIQGEGDTIKEYFLDFLLNHVYEKSLVDSGIAADSDIREKLEYSLIDSNGNRRHVPSDNLSFITKPALDSLKEKRIINEIDHHFELSHDSLCPLIFKNREKRRATKDVEVKAAFNKILIKKQYWSDYFVFLPVFLLIGLCFFFLYNATLNESVQGIKNIKSLCHHLTFEEKIKHPFVLWIGNIMMIVLSLSVANLLYLYTRKYQRTKYRIYGGILLLASVVLCYWHSHFYITPNHHIFKYIESYIAAIGWMLIYIYLIIVPLVLFIQSFWAKEHQKEISWKDLFFMMKLFSLHSVKIYTIVILFICIYLSVVPQTIITAISTIGSGFVFLIGALTFSLFYKKSIWTRGLKEAHLCYAPFFLLSIGLACFDGQIFPSFPPISVNWYLWILFILFVFGECYICFTYVNRRKYKPFLVLACVIIITGAASILYVGLFPWQKSKLIKPTIATSSKWKFYCYRQNGLYGANLYNGEELVPCVFDTLLTYPLKLVLQIPKEYLQYAEKDSYFYSQGNDSFSCLSYNIDAKLGIMNFNPALRFDMSLDADGDNKEEKELHQCAINAYKELINSVLMRLKSGDSLSSAKVESVQKLESLAAKRADLIYNHFDSIRKQRGETKTIATDTLVQFIEAANREIITAGLLDMFKENVVFNTTGLLPAFEVSFFHKTLSREKCHVTVNRKYEYTSFFEFKKSKDNEEKNKSKEEENTDSCISVPFHVETYFDLERSTDNQIESWLNIWRYAYAIIRGHVQYDWTLAFETISNGLVRFENPINDLIEEMKDNNKSKEEILSTIKKTGAISEENFEEVLVALRKAEDSLQKTKRLREKVNLTSGDIVKALSFKEDHKHIAEICEKRMKQIRHLTDRTAYESIGRSIARDMICLCILSDFTKSTSSMIDQAKKDNNEGKAMGEISELSIEATKSMCREDVISVNKAYHELIELQESQIKAINNAVRLFNLSRGKAE